MNRMLRWSAPRVTPTKKGMQSMVTAPVTDEFMEAWKRHRGAIRRTGVEVRKHAKTGALYAVYFRPIGVGASHEHSGLDARGRPLAYRAPEGEDYMPFQHSGIHYALPRKAALIGDEPGLGKTIQAVGLMNNLPAELPSDRFLVIPPANLRLNWGYELAKWLIDQREIVIVDRKTPIPAPGRGPVAVVASYESLVSRRKEFVRDPWSLVVFDEVHYLKNPKSQRTPAAKALKAYRKLLLSGTPLLKRPIDLWPLLTIMDQQWCSWKDYVRRYCDGHQRTMKRYLRDQAGNILRDPYGAARYKEIKIWEKDGASNLESLQHELRTRCMIRRLKADVLPDLPPKRYSVIPVALDGSRRRDHERKEIQLAEFEDLLWTVYRERRHGPLPNNPRFHEMAQVREEMGRLKAPAVASHVIDLLSGLNKIVVFAHHHAVAEELDGWIRDAGFATVLYTGRVSHKERDRRKTRFQDDPECRVFVGTLGAAGEGLTLTASADVLFAELPWRAIDVAQAEDRCHRMGQTDSVNVRFYVFPGSIDEKMVRHVVEKRLIAQRTLDAPAKVKRPDDAADRRSVSAPAMAPGRRPAPSPAENFLDQLAGL